MAKVKDTKKEKKTHGIEETLGGIKKASLKIVSFTICKIQHCAQFPMNQTLFSNPIQSAEVFIIYSKTLNRMGRKLVLSWSEWTNAWKQVHRGLSKQISSNRDGKSFNKKDGVAAVRTSLFWGQSMSEKLAEALASKTYWQSGPMEMPSTHCVIIEQCYRHQGKANTLISGLKEHQLQILQLLLLSHGTEPDVMEAIVIL